MTSLRLNEMLRDNRETASQGQRMMNLGREEPEPRPGALIQSATEQAVLPGPKPGVQMLEAVVRVESPGK